MAKTFGIKLRELRDELGMSQDELAAQLHTSKQVLSRYETEQRIPKLDTVQRYAELLRVPLLYLADNSVETLEELDRAKKWSGGITMIITTCDTIPGKGLEYLGLVSRSQTALFGASKKQQAANADNLANGLEEALAAAAAERGADAVIGVKITAVSSVIVAIGTAVKFR